MKDKDWDGASTHKKHTYDKLSLLLLMKNRSSCFLGKSFEFCSSGNFGLLLQIY